MTAQMKRALVVAALVGVAVAAALAIRIATTARVSPEATPDSLGPRPVRMLMFSVLDSAGRPVEDVLPEQVRVFDDGVPQAVTLERGPAAVEETGASVQSRQRKSVLVVLDDLHMNQAGMRRVSKLCETLFAALLADDDKVAVIATGPAGLAVDFTTDTAAVLKDLAGTRPIGTPDGDVPRQAESQQDHVALATVYGLVTRLRGVEGQKTILWIGGRYSFDVPSSSDVARLLTSDPFSQQRSEAEPRALEMKLVQLAAAANSVGAVIHAFDVEGDGDDGGRREKETKSALANLAELTGGRSTVGMSDTQRVLPAMRAAADRYYRIAYVPPTAVAEPARHLREMRIVVKRPGLSWDETRWVLAGM